MNKVSRVSQVLCRLFYASALLNLVIYGYVHFFLFPEKQAMFSGAHLLLAGENSVRNNVIDGLIGLPSALLTTFIFYRIGQLFFQYAKLDFFTEENNRSVHSIGVLLIAQVPLDILSVPLIAMALSEGTITMTFSSIPFFQTITGLVAICIGWIFQEALKLKEEQALTV